MTLTWTNPVWPGYLADPFVLRWRGEYWAYGTGGAQAQADAALRRIFPVLHSADFQRWEHVGGALEPLDDPDMPAYWAPEVAERDGTFYLYYSAGGPQGEGHKLRVAISDRPAGPFHDCGREVVPDEQFSIDASPFRDPRDGRWYLFFAKDFFDGRAGTGIAVAPLAADMRSVVGPVTTVVRASEDWQVYQRNRLWYGRVWDAWHTVEGPSVILHDGRCYCLYSGGRWETMDYGVGCAVADHVLGPYSDPAASQGPTVLRAVPGIPGPGHCSAVLAPDDRTTFLSYHAWDPELTRRRMHLDPLLWTPGGPRCAGPTVGERSLALGR